MSTCKAVTKLLAVVVSLSGCEQLGPPLPASTTPTTPSETATDTPSEADAVSHPGVTAPTAPAKPRTTRNGRPACGNVQGRFTEEMVRRRERECTKPRTHPNGSPAEGNVTSRNPRRPVDDE